MLGNDISMRPTLGLMFDFRWLIYEKYNYLLNRTSKYEHQASKTKLFPISQDKSFLNSIEEHIRFRQNLHIRHEDS
jgi:hypothetical protein